MYVYELRFVGNPFLAVCAFAIYKMVRTKWYGTYGMAGLTPDAIGTCCVGKDMGRQSAT